MAREIHTHEDKARERFIAHVEWDCGLLLDGNGGLADFGLSYSEAIALGAGVLQERCDRAAKTLMAMDEAFNGVRYPLPFRGARKIQILNPDGSNWGFTVEGW